MAMNGNTTNGGAAAPVAFKLSKVNYKDLKFIIMDRPTDENLPSYLRELKKEVTKAHPLPGEKVPYHAMPHHVSFFLARFERLRRDSFTCLFFVMLGRDGDCARV